MATDAKLYFTDSSGNTQTSIKILECDFGFSQDINQHTLTPSAFVRISNINLVVESSKDTQLVDWMVTNSQKKGKIELTIQNNVKKTIEFEEAYCAQYHESFNHLGGESPMQITISFTARVITLDDNVFYRYCEG
ncbi:MAG: hypothetical protein K8R74_06285 [Bacteroidales bacterium]|nr:hypothetical protein [Bacteroidales bacterium]